MIPTDTPVLNMLIESGTMYARLQAADKVELRMLIEALASFCDELPDSPPSKVTS